MINGQVSGTVAGNVVTGDGPIDYIAQNGIQIGFGAALVRENAVSGNVYSPEDWVACGLLFFEADGVKQQANTLFTNERNLCKAGRLVGGRRVAAAHLQVALPSAGERVDRPHGG